MSMLDGLDSPIYTSINKLKDRLDVFPETFTNIELQFQITPKRKSETEKIEGEPKVLPKKQFQKISWEQDFYEGEVLLENLHGQGFYTTIRDGKKFFCDGQFYVNKLEGYSQVFYDDASHFQGLFKQHCRYGPGVLTHPNGSQDVGFWDGFKIIRLSCLVGSSNRVPSLANSALGRSRLMCQRMLVPLDEPNEVLEIIEDLENVVDVAAILDKVFNLDIRHRNSLFFNKKLYDKEFFDDLSNNIKVITDDVQETHYTEFQFDSLADRKGSLRNKINELTESFHTFSDIKKALQQKINICTECCNKKCIEVVIPKEETTQKVSLGVSSDTLSITLSDFSSRSGVSERKEVSQHEEQEESCQSAMTLIKTYLKHVCECTEEGIGDLQKLQDQIRNVDVQEAYYRIVREQLQKKLDRIVEREFQQQHFKYKLVPVKSIFAWNNEDYMMKIQEHSFKHRNSENLLNFDVAKLIRGDRKDFGPKSTHETTCHHFLSACFEGDGKFVQDCLRASKVHPNLADAGGSTGVFYAVAGKQKSIIPVLTNFGGKLDQLNDEQLTPLNVTLLMYIACLNNYTDWETSFLMEILPRPIPNIPMWHDIKSFLSVSSSADSWMPSSNPQRRISNKRIINLIRSNTGSMFGTKSHANNLYAFDLQCKVKTESKQKSCFEDNRKIDLVNIWWTIAALLEYGSSPNVCKTPYTSLILALFTENPAIVGEVLKAKADTSVTINENLTCLHLAASLNPSEPNVHILKILIESGSNPNARTDSAHWKDKNVYFKGKLPEGCNIEDEGKTPLHLLCMRPDYVNDESGYFPSVATMLLEASIDVEDEYLGHSALSLAVLLGNIDLVECLIKSSKFNPYKPLGYGMGNILTLYALDRFSDILSLETCKLILSKLVQLNLNVLHKVHQVENAIVFVEDFDTFFDEIADVSDAKKGKENKNARKKKIPKLKRKVLMVEFMKTLARQSIVRRLQIVVTKMLYDFIEEGILDSSPLSATLSSQYLQPSQAAKCLEELFHNGAIHEIRYNENNVQALLMFVDVHKKAYKIATKKEKKVKKSGSKKVVYFTNNSQSDITTVEDEEHSEKAVLKIINDLDLKYREQDGKSYVVAPGSDDAAPYEVCFNCLRNKQKELRLCPRCQMIFFCSVTCIKNDQKIKGNVHNCNINFDWMEQEPPRQISQMENLSEIMEKVEQKCNNRLNAEIARRFSEEQEQLMALWRADTYGTKMLKLKQRLETASVNSGDLINVQITQLKSLLDRVVPKRTPMCSWDNLMSKLKSKSRMQTTSAPLRSYSNKLSNLGGTTVESLLISDVTKTEQDLQRFEVLPVPGKRWKCTKINVDVPPSRPSRSPQLTMEKLKEAHLKDDTMKQLMVASEKQTLPRKVKFLPERYQQFVETVSTYFPGLEISSWLLPYACCNDGQLYYQFFDTNLFKESYSFS